MKENKITQITDKEHCLLRPGIYLGSIVPTVCNTYILDKKAEKFKYQEIEYNPGFLKICYEIIDNSIDEAVRTDFAYGNKIEVSIIKDENKIIVKDNGRGIPLGIDKATGKSQLELALTELRSGSNFNDVEGRTSLGMNGVGSALTVIYSKEFVAVSQDGKQKGTLTCTKNLETKDCIIEDFKCSKKEQGTTISFIPDLKRFGLRRIGDIHANLIHQRMMFLSYIYPEIEFFFDGIPVKFKNVKNLMSTFAEHYVAIQDDNKPCKYLIGIFPNNTDDFTHKSYINGADCINGGNHLDYIHSELLNKIREKLNRKYASIRNGDIKNKLSYIVCFREFVNPMFNSQTKENFSSDVGEIKKFLENVDWEAVAQKVVKTPEIIDPIIEMFKIKEELKNRQALAGMSKSVRKFKCDKFLPATKEQKYLAIVEGDCLDEYTPVKSMDKNKIIPINKLKIGDLVLTHEQNIKPVVSTTRKLAFCYHLKTKSGKDIVCSKDHRLFVYDTLTNEFCYKKLENIHVDTDKLVKNRLADNFSLDKIIIETLTDDSKYALKIYGDYYIYKSSLEHKYVVFDKNIQKFYLKQAKDINPLNDLMVLLNVE